MPDRLASSAPLGVRRAAAVVRSDPAWRFLTLFVVYLGIAALAYPLIALRELGVVGAMEHGTAKLAYGIVGVVSPDVVLNGIILETDNLHARISEECTAIYALLIFAAAVLAYPARTSQRALGLLLGLPLLYALNLVRIALLVAVAEVHRGLFDFMHLYFWQATMILMITALWLLWIFKVVAREPSRLASRT